MTTISDQDLRDLRAAEERHMRRSQRSRYVLPNGAVMPEFMTPDRLREYCQTGDVHRLLPAVGEVVRFPDLGTGGTVIRVEPEADGGTGWAYAVTYLPAADRKTHTISRRADHPYFPVVVDEVLPSMLPFVEAMAEQLAEHDRTVKRHSEEMDTLVARAHEYAEDNDLCERFDEFMVENDLPARIRRKRGSVDVTVRISLEVEHEVPYGSSLKEELEDDDILPSALRAYMPARGEQFENGATFEDIEICEVEVTATYDE